MLDIPIHPFDLISFEIFLLALMYSYSLHIMFCLKNLNERSILIHYIRQNCMFDNLAEYINEIEDTA